MATKSLYFNKLDVKTKERYNEKISFIENVDPYLVKKEDFSNDVESFPSVTYPHIVNYFLFAPSPLTKDQLKAYKALESYNQFVSGWVKDVGVKEFGNYVLLNGRVIG